jgi:hypothetical protein
MASRKLQTLQNGMKGGLSILKPWLQKVILFLVILAQVSGWVLFAQQSFAISYRSSLPPANSGFYFFGMGLREKYLYRNGWLIHLASRRVLQEWKVSTQQIEPAEYTVILIDQDGQAIQLREDEQAVWLVDRSGSRPIEGTQVPLKLPTFEGHPQRQALRILHHEVLIGITPNGPLPNILVYSKPWYRDAAMMAMVLEKTGNLEQIRAWILSLREPYDMNNSTAEPDNLGQVLYLISLVSDKNHPLVPVVLAEAERRAVVEDGLKYLDGITDGARHPVYQTKWLKFGLRKLGLPDDWTIPKKADSYSSLFWMDYKEAYVPTKDAADRERYPYLAWATAHFHALPPGPLNPYGYPLTWEAEASKADYAGMAIVDRQYVRRRMAVPHAWHAAEAFLYLVELTTGRP